MSAVLASGNTCISNMGSWQVNTTPLFLSCSCMQIWHRCSYIVSSAQAQRCCIPCSSVAFSPALLRSVQRCGCSHLLQPTGRSKPTHPASSYQLVANIAMCRVILSAAITAPHGAAAGITCTGLLLHTRGRASKQGEGPIKLAAAHMHNWCWLVLYHIVSYQW
jgi:hypothetical protein